MHIAPFKAFLPAPALAQQVCSKPFDFYTKEKLAEVLNANPLSFLNVIKPDFHLADKAEPNSPLLFERSRAKFLQFCTDGVFTQETQAAYYIYRQTNAQGKSTTGLIAACSLADYTAGHIKKHEQTIQRKEEVLKDYLKAVKINAEPVLLTYPANNQIAGQIATIVAGNAPTVGLVVDNVSHQLWRIDSEALITFFTEAFDTIENLYVADGHHRLASSELLAEEMGSGNPAYGQFMAALFADDELGLFEFNRLVRDLNGQTPHQFMEQLMATFDIKRMGIEAVLPTHLHHIAMYMQGAWFYMTVKQHLQPTLLANNPIDAQLLTDTILNPLLGIADLRNDKRIAFMSGTRPLNDLTLRVDSGKFAVAFVLHPVSFEQFYAVSDADGTMPPKSTWFEPKLLNGLVVYHY